MRSITFSQLRIARRLDQLEAWLRDGGSVELLYYKRVVAHFVPRKPWPFIEEEEALFAKKRCDHKRKEKPTAA
jgi:hypothetical protein